MAFGRLSPEDKDAALTKALDDMGRRMGEKFKREAEEKAREEREFQLWMKQKGL